MRWRDAQSVPRRAAIPIGRATWTTRRKPPHKSPEQAGSARYWPLWSWHRHHRSSATRVSTSRTPLAKDPVGSLKRAPVKTRTSSTRRVLSRHPRTRASTAATPSHSLDLSAATPASEPGVQAPGCPTRLSPRTAPGPAVRRFLQGGSQLGHAGAGVGALAAGSGRRSPLGQASSPPGRPPPSMALGCRPRAIATRSLTSSPRTLRLAAAARLSSGTSTRRPRG